MEMLRLLSAIEVIARQAGAAILQIYATDFVVRGKADASPVTAADEAAEALIVAGLRALTPDWPVVAEEAASRGETPALGDRFWLVDPLDGTREFVSRNGEFTVNIALIQGGQPLLGVVYVPVHQRLFAGLCGVGAWVVEGDGEGEGEGEGNGDADAPRRAIRCRNPPAAGATLASSRSHADEALLAAWLRGPAAGTVVAARIQAGSSLKFGLIAAGEADLYPRFGPTMEWDTAAGHAVLAAAGGSVCDLAGQPLCYGKAGFKNPHFVARGAGCPPATPGAGF